jgi:CheY-like chemotaxis protein
VNLVNNAVKFTSRGGVSISATPGQEMLEVRVADTGEGIYPEETDSIFEEFFRTADSPEGRPQGSGLGLSITRKIVELHGGTVKVDSEIGKGSVFSFTVPLDVEKLMVETDNAPAAYHGVYTSGDEGISGHRLIMVVEQNSAIRQLMRKRLESMGYTTLGAGSGKAAFDLCVDRSPDLVLSTILSYPDTDINLHKRLRASAKTSCIPIILTSIAIGPSSSLTAAANGYISRPLDRFDLITEAGKLLSHGRGPVLIISSYQHEARSAQVILSNEGYKVMVADAASGTDPIKSESPKLVILDGSLPSGGTLDILTALRCDEETRSIPVMLITDLPLPDKHVTLVTENRKRPKPGEDGLVTLINEVRQILGRSGRGICR